MIPSGLPDPGAREFSWEDGERLIRFGGRALDDAPDLLETRGFAGYALLTTDRGRSAAPVLVAQAEAVLQVPAGPVPEAAAAVRTGVEGRSLVALGGGRVIDSAKAIAGADDLRCAAIPTTLSGAEMTPFHRMPAGVDEWKLVRPQLVIASPPVMASQPMPDLAASAMNALAHAIEALYTPMATPATDDAALRSARLIAAALEEQDPVRADLALGALYAGYASGIAGFAVHHAVCQTIVRLCGTPHAQTNAVMLPHFVRMMERRAPDAIRRLGEAMGAPDVAGRVTELASLSGITRLEELGVQESSLDEIVAAALQHPALGNTPDPPRADELRELLQAALALEVG